MATIQANKKLIAVGSIAKSIGIILFFGKAPMWAACMLVGLGSTLIVGGWIRMSRSKPQI